MAREVNIGGSGTVFVGEDKTFRLEVYNDDGTVPDMTGWTVTFDVRAKDNSTTAILQKSMSITGTYGATRGTNGQRAYVVLSDTELNLFKADTYRYSMKRMDDTVETVLAYGDFAPQKATAP